MGDRIESLVDAHEDYMMLLELLIKSNGSSNLIDSSGSNTLGGCDIRKWMSGDGYKLRQHTAYDDLLILHIEFHRLTESVVLLTKQNRGVEALSILKMIQKKTLIYL